MCMETRSQTVRPRWRYLLLIRAHFPRSPMCWPYAMRQSAERAAWYLRQKVLVGEGWGRLGTLPPLSGTKLPIQNVRALVAIEGKADNICSV
jgi:hypothetical protein